MEVFVAATYAPSVRQQLSRRNMNNNIYWIVFLSLCLIQNVFTQPYIYYQSGYPPDSNGSVKISRLNLTTSKTEQFLSQSVPGTSELKWDGTQSWIYYWTGDDPNQGPVIVINTQQPQLSAVLPDENTKYSFSLRYIHQQNHLYVSNQSMNYSFDPKTLAKIDSFDISSFTFDGNEFISEDGKVMYYIVNDSITGQWSINGLSLVSKHVISKKLLDQIGPSRITKVLFDGRFGKALIGFNYPSSNSVDGQYVIYDAFRDSIYSTIHFPIITTDIHFSVDTRYVIIQETPPNPDRSPEAQSHILSGKISIYNSNTGKLICKLNLKPGGKILVFDNYPNMVYYYLSNEQRSINIDLNKLIP